MKQRRFVALLLALTMVFTLVACGGKKGATEEAQEVMKVFTEGMRKADLDKLNTIVPKSQINPEATTGDELDDVTKAVLDRFETVYKSGEIKDDATTGELTYEFKSVDITSLTSDGSTGSPTVEDIKNIETFTTDIVVQFVKEDDGWKISNAQEIVGLAMGFGKLLENN